jgi:two-component system, NtrC family, nitrogen regulation sensor histidine kinase NtrY
MTLAAALTSLLLGVVLAAGALRVWRIECCWPAMRERLVTDASRFLQTSLGQAIAEARRLAERGATAASLPREAVFDRLGNAIESGPSFERGAAVLSGGPDSTVIAWSGRHRTIPSAPDTTELQAVMTPFYAVLEARRQAQIATSVGSVLLSTSSAIADGDRSLVAEFARRYGVSLRVFPAGQGPRDSSVFEICNPRTPPKNACAPGDTLFSVQTMPPSQGDAKLAALANTAWLARLGLVVLLAVLLAAAPAGAWRWGVLLLAAWTLLRAPLGPGALFSPATFYRPVAGIGTSAGGLLVAAVLSLVAAGALWRRGIRRTWWGVAAAAVLLGAAPYVVRYFGRGIAPPAGGVSIELWLSWQAALAVTAMALILLAAALVRGSTETQRVSLALPLACIWGALAAIGGLWLWNPNGAWPEWYTFLWLPALAGAILPAPRRWALVGMAVVTGTAAALVAWGAAVEGRLSLASRDAQRLGHEGDPVAVALLERLGQQVTSPSQAPPRSAGDLYALWVGSPLIAEDYPAMLELWGTGPEGPPLAELQLAQLDLKPALLSGLARSAIGGPHMERREAIPGVHYILVAPLKNGTVLTVAVGPRTRWLAPNRVARFLRGDPGIEPPYTISLSLPVPTSAVGATVEWRREGWTARGERQVEMVDGVRHVHLGVPLGGPWGLLVRGVLVVGLDVILLGAIWLLVLGIVEGWNVRVPALITTWRTSYRAQLTSVLIAFFVLPVIGFAAWSFTDLVEDARRFGDLLIRQTLRDAAVGAQAVAQEAPDTIPRSLAELGRRLDAELWLYRRGVLVATSSPALAELGLVDPFLAPPVFRGILEDELETTIDARTAGRPTRVGFLVVAPGPSGEQAVLAVPQLLDDERIRQQREDLTLGILLATFVGLAAAIYLAGLAARRLAKPVAALREAAIAVGRGSEPPAFPPGTPREFEPVLSAFDRMATEVRRSQGALEEARQRTARVLANVATGVIAVDDGLRVTLANPRASELVLGGGGTGGTETLVPGNVLPQATAAGWTPVWNAVAEFIAEHRDQIKELEFDVGGRQIRVQLALLGAAPDGCVIALDDATDLTRAARVLAWGEMARQVAHEIKNPLTPIRLGIQHLQRVRGKGPSGAFETTLKETSERILAEIDRLDGIARAFSRFGAPPPSAAEQLPLEPVDLAAIAREVVRLYDLGATPRFEVQTSDGAPPPALARKDEVKEVLVNLLENARNAEATRVTVQVAASGRQLVVLDDGRGIPAEALPRVFEPTFSTTSSGAGLGLAIARRLVESWGGLITLESGPGKGTRVTLTLHTAS